jgi:hypothetical protein
VERGGGDNVSFSGPFVCGCGVVVGLSGARRCLLLQDTELLEFAPSLRRLGLRTVADAEYAQEEDLTGPAVGMAQIQARKFLTR